MMRAARYEDIPALVQLENVAFKKEMFPLSARQFRYHIKKQNPFLVLEEGGKLCGYILLVLYKKHKVARCISVAVNPSCRNKGYARDLFQAAEQQAGRMGFCELRLETRKGTAKAPALVPFYSKLGYEPFEVFKGYYLDGMDAVRMRKTLPSKKCFTDKNLRLATSKKTA